MNSSHSVATDTKNKVVLPSAIISAKWTSTVAVAGYTAGIVVRTQMVGEGSKIEIKCNSSKGKAPDNVKSTVHNNVFTFDIHVPEKVDPKALLWFEAKLPQLGLQMISGKISAHAPIYATDLKWGKPDVWRMETVGIQGTFKGCDSNSDVTVMIYEYDADGHHDKIKSISTRLSSNKLKETWAFLFPGETNKIPTETELAKSNKHYTKPQFFFVVVIDGVRIGLKQESGLLTFTDAIMIETTIGVMPASGYLLTIETADGKKETWQLDKYGKYFADDIPPGRITLLKLEKPSSAANAKKATGSYAQITSQLTGASRHIVAMPDISCTVVCSGEIVLVQMPGHAIMVDAHMHIQSNNSCPLPLQCALFAATLPGIIFWAKRSQKKRVEIAAILASGVVSLISGRLGALGRNSTDLIAKINMGAAESKDMNKASAGVLLSEDEWNKLNDDKKRIEKAAEIAKLEDLSNDTQNDFINNFIFYHYSYYANTIPLRMNIALLMDMSFSHFWGRFGIPVYLSSSEGLWFINDFMQVTFDIHQNNIITTVCCNDEVLNPTSKRASPLRISNGDILHLYAKSLPNDAFNWNAILSKEVDAFDDCNTKKTLGQKPTSPFFCSFEQKAQGSKPSINKTQISRIAVKKQYIHFVSKIPDTETIAFEEYDLQVARSQGSAVQFPLSIFPFYHVDPRRVFDENQTSTMQIVQNMLAGHAFFKYQTGDLVIDKIEYADGTNRLGGLNLDPDEELNSLDNWHCQLMEQMQSLATVDENLFACGTGKSPLFWGIKMYPRLGYAPNDFGHYPQLDTLFTKCMNNKIPITVHCSRGGMSIADYHNFLRYDSGIVYTDFTYKLDKINSEIELNFADENTSPENWDIVLTKYNKLKLCLAHFGGYDVWKECGDFEKLNTDVHPDTEKKNRYDLWIKKIVELIDGYPDVYTDLSYFINPDNNIISFDRNNVAKNLVYLLNKYPSLKDRLLVGSDWYIIEMEKFKGVGLYMHHMFLMLKEVSKSVSYDAWHQFAVVNPLRFLGLIPDAKGVKGPYSLDVKALDKYGKLFEPFFTDSKWKDRAYFTGNAADIRSKRSATLDAFSLNASIADSADIKDTGTLLILK